MAKTKILFVTHEMTPFLELSKISEITRHLPQAMQEKGFEIRILMPRFGVINERRNRLHEVIRLSGMNIVVDNTDNPLIIKVASLPAARMQVYFLDNEEFFQRKKVFTDDSGKFFADNAERSMFFCKGVMETVRKLGWAPDVVHCHGWFTSLVPAYLKEVYNTDPIFKDSQVLFSLYNEEMAGELGERYAQMASADLGEGIVEKFGKGSLQDLYKGALSYSDIAVVMEEGVPSEVIDLAKSKEVEVIEGLVQEEGNYDAFEELFARFETEEEEQAV